MTIARISGDASWGRDGQILVGSAVAGVQRVPAAGGDAVTLVAPEPGFIFGDLQVLPDGRSFLYARTRAGGVSETFVRSLDRDDASSVLQGATARYAPSGHLVFARGSGLNAIAFDLRSRRTSGAPVVVEELQDLNVYQQYDFAVSDEGTLAYLPDLEDASRTHLVAVDAAGATTATPVEPRFFSDPRLSPDGSRLAIHLQEDENDIWVADLARGSLMRLSTDMGEDETPAWSPDGRFVAWTATRPSVPRGIYKRAADASGGEELLWTTNAHLHVNDWSPDGTLLLLEILNPEHGADLYRLRLGGAPAPEAFLKTRFREHSGRISPSGRHVAYVSDESGRDEVYVQSFPEPGGKLQVSTSGGLQPLWSHDGRRVYFRGGGRPGGQLHARSGGGRVHATRALRGPLREPPGGQPHRLRRVSRRPPADDRARGQGPRGAARRDRRRARLPRERRGESRGRRAVRPCGSGSCSPTRKPSCSRGSAPITAATRAARRRGRRRRPEPVRLQAGRAVRAARGRANTGLGARHSWATPRP